MNNPSSGKTTQQKKKLTIKDYKNMKSYRKINKTKKNLCFFAAESTSQSTIKEIYNRIEELFSFICVGGVVWCVRFLDWWQFTSSGSCSFRPNCTSFTSAFRGSNWILRVCVFLTVDNGWLHRLPGRSCGQSCNSKSFTVANIKCTNLRLSKER